MFGFSRGAFIVRAVAGMLQRFGTLESVEDFDTRYAEAMKVWRDLRENSPSVSLYCHQS